MDWSEDIRREIKDQELFFMIYVFVLDNHEGRDYLPVTPLYLQQRTHVSEYIRVSNAGR